MLNEESLRKLNNYSSTKNRIIALKRAEIRILKREINHLKGIEGNILNTYSETNQATAADNRIASEEHRERNHSVHDH